MTADPAQPAHLSAAQQQVTALARNRCRTEGYTERDLIDEVLAFHRHVPDAIDVALTVWREKHHPGSTRRQHLRLVEGDGGA